MQTKKGDNFLHLITLRVNISLHFIWYIKLHLFGNSLILHFPDSFGDFKQIHVKYGFLFLLNVNTYFS